MEESLETPLPLVLPLASAEATLANVGGKGASLARLAAAGLLVPPGFHVTTAAYDLFVATNDLRSTIAEAVSVANVREPATLETAAARVEDLFAAAPIPDVVAQAVARAYADLAPGDDPVAVRSSATAEDLPGMSFAGQLESFLNVRGEAAVLLALKRCWASLWTARAIGYRAGYGIPPEEVSIAVVVQHLVPAEAAGVLFTANPLNGDRDQVVINAAWGLGPAIVGGLVTPDTIVADKATGAVAQEQIADKAVMSVLTEQGTAEVAVPEAERRAPVLGPAQVADLVRAGVSIEALYGQAMDVEWAVHDGQTVILQARPITALPERAPGAAGEALREWHLPDPKGRYARASAIELMPDPLSPLFATLALPRWGRTMGAELARLFGLSSVMDTDELEAAGEHVFITINDYAYYDIGFLTSWMGKFVRALPQMTRGLGSLLGASDTRWSQEARPRYAATVAEWEGRDLGQLPAAELLRGAERIVDETARHYMAIQAGILPAAYMSEAQNRLSILSSPPAAFP